jgi:hypothetical protein
VNEDENYIANLFAQIAAPGRKLSQHKKSDRPTVLQ